MKYILPILISLATLASAAPLVYEGTAGPGKGRHIVFLAGEEEYRSEESLPALARLLARHHGFKCTVLFNLDGNSGEIVPGNSNMPGMEALDSADLAVVFLRFQAFPLEQMRHFDDFLNRGGPVIGMRTATHGFKIASNAPFAKYSFNSKVSGYELGFGHQILGQTWVGHYGTNHKQSTRITLVNDRKTHPILRGVKDIWVQAGAYVGKPVTGEILTVAQPLNGMSPDSPPDLEKAPMPSEWTRSYQTASGKTGRVFTTLYGTSKDITNEGYRRMLVNGCFWALGLEDAIKPDLQIGLVGPFRPSEFVSRAPARGIKPGMYSGYESAIPANATTENPPVAKAEPDPDDPYANETEAGHNARMAWWRQAKFGLFIHWGAYAVPAGTYKGRQIEGAGEWIMFDGKIPVDDYRAFAGEFNPVRYDPEFWAGLAAEAGMKYVIITAKHHDGFALYDSKVTDWDIAGATPYGKDLLAPLVTAVKQRGLKMGFYYSQAQDWIHPGGAKMRHPEGGGWDDQHKGNFDQYLRAIALPQTREILSNYDLDVLWWDTPVWMNADRARLFLPLLRLRPGIIHNNRLGGNSCGDTDTPENFIPATGIPGRDWETCMTMNNTWGYSSHDHDWKPAEDLIRKLVDIVSKGGNFLLNIGPKADGTIPQESIDRLRAVGNWMKVNGEAIYATTASPTQRPRWGRITTKPTRTGTRLYLHVFDWPADGSLLVPVRNKVLGCALLADPGRTFKTAGTGDVLTVSLAGAAPDKFCSVVVLEVAGPPEVADLSTGQAKDGSLTLEAADAVIQNGNYGTQASYEKAGGKGHIGNWHSARVRVDWPIRVTAPGAFEVELEAAVADPGCKLTIRVGDQKLTAPVPATGSHDIFRVTKLGRITIEKAGVNSLSLEPVKDGWKSINLRSVRLLPPGGAGPETQR